MKLYYSILLACLLLVAPNVGAQITDIKTMFPDEEFRNYCLKYFDTDDDGTISQKEADNVRSVSIYGNKVKSMKGIEWFPNLKELSCTSKLITELDISKNAKLNKLYCSATQITELNLNNNRELTSLSCSKTLIKKLNLSDVPLLTTLRCEEVSIAALDLTSLVNLEILYCSGNNWSELNLSGNPKLKTLNCTNNALSNLDLSNNLLIQGIYCDNNKLTSLNLLKHKTISSLRCSHNSLTNLDLAGNKYLYDLVCNDNLLSALSLSNNRILNKLICSNNKLIKLDLSNNYRLKNLECNANKITNLVLTNNNDLTRLDCADNNLKQLIFPDAPNEKEIFANYAGNPNLTVIKNESISYSENEVRSLITENLGDYPVDSLHNLVPYAKGVKWGFMDKNTKKAIGKPIYRTIGFFKPVCEGTFNSGYNFSIYKEDGKLKIATEKIPEGIDIMGMSEKPSPIRTVSSDDGYRGFTVDADGKLATYSDIYKAQSYDLFNVVPFQYKNKYYANATLKDTNYDHVIIDTEGNYAPGFEQVYKKANRNSTASSDNDEWLLVEEQNGKRYFQNMQGKRKLEGELFTYPRENRFWGLMCVGDGDTSAVLDMQTMAWIFAPQKDLRFQDVKYASKEKIDYHEILRDKPKAIIYIGVTDGEENQYYIDLEGTKYLPKK